MIWNVQPNATDGAGNPLPLHPYQQAEAARKILNNTTTVSHTFAVWVTVGYFEVVDDTTPAGWPANVPAPVKLGKEYYREVPGDTRHKFFAVVDRTQVGIDPTSYVQFLNSGTAPIHAQSRPFSTTIEAANALAGANPATINISVVSGDATAVQVYSDGVPVNIIPGVGQPNSVLVIGTGADREIVQVTGITQVMGGTATTPAFATLTLPPRRSRRTTPSAVVSNIVPGNPGPQPGFDVANTAMYGAVVPHWSRLPQ